MTTLVWLDGRKGLDPLQIGGKATGINAMRGMGLPVPPAFTLTTDAYRSYHRAGRILPDGTRAALADGISRLEQKTGRRFGVRNGCPLRVSVRSGAARSMPGMLDTVLDLGAAPDTAWEELTAAVAAVFDSWWSKRAVAYRRAHQIGDDGGTAVTVQAMVFGDADDDSGTGVLFTRHPVTGAPEPFGEWLPRARGEDLVAGRSSPEPLSALSAKLPAVHRGLLSAARQLEAAARWPQDIEFTVERGHLWLLQTRDAHFPAMATARVAVALERDGLIDVDEALRRAGLRDGVRPDQSRSPYRATGKVLARGLPASPGIAAGTVVSEPVEAEERAASGEDVILARPSTDPQDMPAMYAARAVITEVGGATSHAAIVCRELGRPCVVGCGPDTVTTLAGCPATVDGGSGEITAGIRPAADGTATPADPDLAVLHTWLRERQRGVPLQEEAGT
ncbi:PEP/pyruvate-binding domain-containing protein [Streptomyces syringium]|uniref:PEP/pyruvate-binding domain-containing protein n=1 Tax=Streptomyces syringium TaxID=76729 RepID=UPI0034519EDB